MQGRLFGHPIHAMLVHFPSAFFPAALLFSILSYYFHDPLFAKVEFYMLGLGVFFGVLAVCFGAIDYIKIPSSHAGWQKATWHASLNVLWLIVLGTILGVEAKSYPDLPIPSITHCIVLLVTVLGLIFSNYLGGELVFHHKIGLKE